MKINLPQLSEKKSRVSVEKMGAFIASIQKENGEIPWSICGKTDPFDHIESAMGLCVVGFYKEAQSANLCLIGT
ncbi:MAG: hypothetical protein RBT06_01075, partial [Smithellaceae bacterium]|nr:hypothetical protein [Smithellaceae bacterium]